MTWKTIHLLNVYQTENPENIPTLLVFDDLMDYAYSTKVSVLFTKGCIIAILAWYKLLRSYFTKLHRHVIFL